MKFGMNLLLWTDDATKEEFLPMFAKLKKMGFDGVEIPVFNLDVKKYEALGKHLDDLGLERTAVTVRTAADNPISPDAEVRKAGVAATKTVLECCQAGGMTVLAGPYYAALGVFTGQGPTKDEWKWGVESMRPVAEHAKTCGVTMALEYLNRFEIYLLNCAADAARFVKDVGHPNCRMMYDTFHANIEEKDIKKAINECADVMVHVHISENDRGTPGQGHVDWETTFKTLRKIKYKGWLTIEAFGLALPALAAATKIWRPLFPSEDVLAVQALEFLKSKTHARA